MSRKLNYRLTIYIGGVQSAISHHGTIKAAKTKINRFARTDKPIPFLAVIVRVDDDQEMYRNRFNNPSDHVNQVIVYPCAAGFAITKYGAGKLISQPTFDRTWTRRDMRKALRNLYPKAEIKFRDVEHEVVIETVFQSAWQELRPKVG